MGIRHKRPDISRKVESNVMGMRDEFKRYLSEAMRESKYPYSEKMVPKIEAVAESLFDPGIFFAQTDVFVASILQRTPSPPVSRSQNTPLTPFLEYSAPVKRNLI